MSEEKYMHEQHMVHPILYQIFLCTRWRRKALVGLVRDRFAQVASGGVQEHGWQRADLAIQPDHKLVFIQANPCTLTTAIARLFKGRSSHLLRGVFLLLRRIHSLWTRCTCFSKAGVVCQNTVSASRERQSKP